MTSANSAPVHDSAIGNNPVASPVHGGLPQNGLPQSQDVWFQRYQGAMMNTFGKPQRVLVRGEGSNVWDADGNRYLDLLAGIAVNTLGHAHPTLTGAMSAQLSTLGHISNFFASPAQINAAERIIEVTGAPEGSAVFFTNSGTEALEAAVKLARKYGGSQKPRILALDGAFHGRSMGALALTAKTSYKEPFGPMMANVEHIPAGDFTALEAAMGSDVAALFIEPIQGEAGVIALPAGYLARARELTHEHGALLILDEVQTGMGRTGTWLASHHEQLTSAIIPDAVTLAKGLGGGYPVGALVAYGARNAQILTPGNHGSTFGGNPVGAAAILATLAVIERDELLPNVTARSKQFQEGITEFAQQSSLIDHVRGLGLLLAIQLAEPVAGQIVESGLEHGIIMNAVAPDAIRIAPPLIISESQVAEFLSKLPAIVQKVEKSMQ